METFPLTRQPILAGQSRTLEDNVIRQDNDAGPPSLRRVTTQLREEHNLTYIITDAERDTLITWYRSNIAQGAKKFEITLDGTTYNAQLTDAPSLTPAGAGGWRLSFRILTLGVV